MSTAPAWESITHDVLCPLCDYNLRGLVDPRCPECGAGFDWAEVTDREKRTHPYLFEHHPKRNAWSFFRTLSATLRPGRFWATLSPRHELRTDRAGLYWLWSTLLMSSVVWAEWARGIFSNWNWSAAAARRFPPRLMLPRPSNLPSIPFSWAHLRETAAAVWRGDPVFDATWDRFVFWALWPWVLLLALQVFRMSMRRAKVHTGHVLRCVVYTFDIGAWLGLIGAAWTLVLALMGSSGSIAFDVFVIASLAVVTYRMWRAYRLYLRFDHAFFTVVAAQVIAMLAVLNWMVAQNHSLWRLFWRWY